MRALCDSGVHSVDEFSSVREKSVFRPVRRSDFVCSDCDSDFVVRRKVYFRVRFTEHQYIFTNSTMETGTRSGKHSFSIEHILSKPEKLQQQNQQNQLYPGRHIHPGLTDNELMVDPNAFVSHVSHQPSSASCAGLPGHSLSEPSHQSHQLQQYFGADHIAGNSGEYNLHSHTHSNGGSIHPMMIGMDGGWMTPDSSRAALDMGETSAAVSGLNGVIGGSMSDDGDSVSDVEGADCEYTTYIGLPCDSLDDSFTNDKMTSEDDL